MICLLFLSGKKEEAMNYLKNGVNANTTDYDGHYPMYYAARMGLLFFL